MGPLVANGRSVSVDGVGRFSDAEVSRCIVTLRLPPNLSGMSGSVSMMVDQQAAKKEKEYRLIDGVLAGNHEDFHGNVKAGLTHCVAVRSGLLGRKYAAQVISRHGR